MNSTRAIYSTPTRDLRMLSRIQDFLAAVALVSQTGQSEVAAPSPYNRKLRFNDALRPKDKHNPSVSSIILFVHPVASPVVSQQRKLTKEPSSGTI